MKQLSAADKQGFNSVYMMLDSEQEDRRSKFVSFQV